MPDDWRKKDWRSDLPLSDPEHPIYKYVGIRQVRYGTGDEAKGRSRLETNVRIPDLGDERLERVLVPAFAMMNFQGARRTARIDTMCAVAALNIDLGGTDEAFKGFTDEIGLVAAPQTDSVYQPLYRWIFGGGSDTSGMITKLSRITEVWAGWPLDQRPIPYDDTETGYRHWFRKNGGYDGIYSKGFGRYHAPGEQVEPFTIHILPRGTPDSARFALYVSGAGEELDEAPTVEHPAIYLNKMDAVRGTERWVAAGGTLSDHPIADKPFGVNIVKQHNRWNLYVDGVGMSLPTAPTKESPATFDKEADAEQAALWWYDAGGVPVEHPSHHNVADLGEASAANQAAAAGIGKLAEAESKVTAPSPQNDADYIVDQVTRVHQQSPGQWFVQGLHRRADGSWLHLHEIPFKTRDAAIEGVPIIVARVVAQIDAQTAAEKQQSDAEGADGTPGELQEATIQGLSEWEANQPWPVKHEPGEVWITAIGKRPNGSVGEVDPDGENADQWTVYFWDGQPLPKGRMATALKVVNSREEAKARAEETRNQPLEDRAHYLKWGESLLRKPEIGDTRIVGRLSDDCEDMPSDMLGLKQWDVYWYVPIATHSTPPESRTIWPVAYRRLRSFDDAKAKAEELKRSIRAIKDLIEKSALCNAGDYRIVGVLDLDTPIAVATGFSGVNAYYAQRCSVVSGGPRAGEKVWPCLPVGATRTKYASIGEAEAAISADKARRDKPSEEEEEQEDDGSFDWFWKHKRHDPERFDHDVGDALESLGEYCCGELWNILQENSGGNIGLSIYALQDDGEPDQSKDLIEALMPFVYDDYDQTYPEIQKYLNRVIEERDGHWDEIGRKNAEITNLKEQLAAKDREIADLKAQQPAAEGKEEAQADAMGGRAKILELTPMQRAAGSQIAGQSYEEGGREGLTTSLQSH